MPRSSPPHTHGAALLNQEVTRQAQIIAYNNDFRMMSFVIIPPLLLLFVMRRHARTPVAAAE